MRKLATWASAFCAGIFLAQYLLPNHLLLVFSAAALGLGVLALFLREPRRYRAVLICTALSVAFGYYWAFALLVQAPAEALAEQELTNVTMVLTEYPSATAYGAKVTVRPDIPGLRGVRAVYYGDASLLELAPGQTVTDDLRLKSAAKIQDDEVTAFISKGVFLLAYGRGEAAYGDGSASSLRWWPARMGQAMRENIAELYPGEAAGFMTAILTGDSTLLSEAAGTDLSEAGTYHIMAVSGLHCSFLAALILALIGKKHRRAAACIAIPILIFYALLTGARPSVVRACVMLSLLLIAPACGREGDPPTALSFAFLLLLLQNPFAAASIGLQLSFGAVAGMLWMTPRMNRFLLGDKDRGRIARAISTSVSATCGSLVFTLPLSAYYFNFLVLVSPLSNLLCLWAVSLIFGAGLISVLLSFAWVAPALLLALIPKGLIVYVLTVVEGLAKIPYHALYYTNPFLKYWLVYFYLLFGVAYLGKSKARRKYAAAAVLVALSLTVTVKLGRFFYTWGTLDIVVVDVGQGSCTTMASGGQFAMMDCGSSSSWKRAGGDAADQLLSMGCRRLDYLVLSHYDYDHVSGVTDLMNRLQVGTVLLPDKWDDAGLREWVTETAETHGAAVELVTEERMLTLGNSTLTVYPPLGTGNDNDSGLALLCTAGDFDLLITGDMDARTEEKLLAAYSLPDIEALIVGHHGSKYSTGEELLAALSPEVAVVSAGRNNYGHPSDEALRRLANAGASVYRTDRQGNTHISVK
ncbi:DNA internalization-related competence protein ComEC/Rec2 [Oscillibacter sp.]|uniref:DNA internalization-related competence protein ComEC/Rec2 n=1 Tax=Oscillibacter sp. TaxID=1945593 RepID=UPI0028A955FE|nr:DNA internalization-related competence protein ComEC/Rec2 [Oscillibacter sp.]